MEINDTENDKQNISQCSEHREDDGGGGLPAKLPDDVANLRPTKANATITRYNTGIRSSTIAREEE